MHERFSVVVTTRNRINFLKRCIVSILNNSVLPIDIIIVNDAGLHISNELFNMSDSLVSLVINNNEVSRGANYCRNLGVKLASQDIVFFIDDDDAVTQDSFHNRLVIMLETPTVGLCFTGINIVNSDDLNLVVRSVEPSSSVDYRFDLLTKGNIIGSTSRVAIRKTYFYQAGEFDEKLACLQDYDLWIRMSQVCKVEHDMACNIIYTIHKSGGQISAQYEKYELARKYLLEKYSSEITSSSTLNKFDSNLLLRVALSVARSSTYQCKKYAFLSMLTSFNLKALVLFLIPFTLLKKIRSFS
jgi:glycosyltransferase involved in cell wall biosynthesis